MVGDEFTVILTGENERKDIELVDGTIIDVLAVPFDVGKHPVQISVSIGIACYPQSASSPVAIQVASRNQLEMNMPQRLRCFGD